MDVTAITQIISGVGFPIAACVMIWYSYNKVLERVMNEMEATTQTLVELTTLIKTAIAKEEEEQ